MSVLGRRFGLAALAGVLAGIAATAFECALWWLSGMAVGDRLFRDASLASAIAVGPTALDAPAAFAWRVLLIATGVHLVLSAVYGIVLGLAIDRLRPSAAILTGAAFGMLLYVINIYGFTIFFPWFTATRDWITATTHVAFGAMIAAIYGIARNDAGTHKRRERAC